MTPETQRAVERVISDENGVQRTMSGETVLGHRVAAWRYHGHFDNPAHGYRYCEHWSTPGNGAVNVERLFTETQVRTILTALSEASAREGGLEGALIQMRDAALYQTGASDGRAGPTIQKIATEKYMAALHSARTALSRTTPIEEA